MAYGDGPHDAALRAAWETFCDRLKDAGLQAFKDHNPGSGIHRVDGLRFLTQNLGQAFDLALETKDPDFPALHAFCGPTRKLGGDCADFTYQQAWIDGRSVYRVRGDRGTAPFLNLTVQGARREGPGVLHEPFGDQPEATLTGDRLQVDADGSFEVRVGGPPAETNWLPTTTDSRKLFIRQGFDTWDDTPARLRIDRLDMSGPKPVPGPAVMVDALGWAGDFVTGLMHDWPEYPFAHGGVDAGRPNTFPTADPDAADRLRGRAAANMYWELGPDDALVIEFEAHAGLWMLTNMGVFFTSMDYLYRPVSYTPGRTAVDADGRIRIVVAHDDPGYQNWLDTQGFERGNITYRHMLDGTPVPLATTVVPRRRLHEVLPADTATVDRGERVAQMLARHDGIRRRYALL
jgi:hypothetical protein